MEALPELAVSKDSCVVLVVASVLAGALTADGSSLELRSHCLAALARIGSKAFLRRSAERSEAQRSCTQVMGPVNGHVQPRLVVGGCRTHCKAFLKAPAGAPESLTEH